MSNTISNNPGVALTPAVRAGQSASTSPPASATASNAVAQVVASPGREGLKPLPEGWKPPVANMGQTPQVQQDYCDYQRMSAAECRRDWNLAVESASEWNARGVSSAVVPTGNKPSIGTELVGVGLAGLIRANDALRRMGVVK